MQATLAFYFLVAGSTLAVAVTLLGGRPHAGALLLLSLGGYPLAAWCLLRYERMGNGSWQVVAALTAGAVSAGTVLDPRG
jgi:hypothetical protein